MNSTVVVASTIARVELVVAGLTDGGCRVVLLPDPTPGVPQEFSIDQIDRYFRDADAFVSSPREVYPRRLIEAAERLRIACSAVIGTENIDVDAASERGILVAHGAVPENYLGVAEGVVALAASLVKRLPEKHASMRAGGWRIPDSGGMIAGRTIGLIGLGRIGQAIARRFAGWDCELIATDPMIPPPVADALGVRLVDLDTLLRTSDVVSIQITLAGDSQHLIGERELALMKPGAYLINVARGDAIDEPALIRALDEGRLAGAGLDVWSQEPPSPDHPLRAHPRVIATAHNVGHSEDAYVALARAAVENTLRGLRGELPLYVKNSDVVPAWRERLARLLPAPITTA